MKDLEVQISFINESVNRILCQIDKDPLSPTFGCAHLAYWRDKTSDVADMRRQEVMLTLSLLYSHDYPGSRWRKDKNLKFAVEALLVFWCKNQYSDGSLDEWYKGERAYAAAAFSTHAVARTLRTMEDQLPENIVSLARKNLKKTTYWLVNHEDLFKTNHQAVGVAALAFAGKILNDDFLNNNAHKKLQSIINVQTKEGWFPEIGHMDIGYTFLTVEFVTMTMKLWGDWKHIELFHRAFDFACEWIHPDLTVGEEYGVCHNPYLSRIAVILMSKYSKRAAYLRHRLEKESLVFKGIAPTLADDLRLLRWSYQPLLAYNYSKNFISTKSIEIEKIPLINSKVDTQIYHDAALVRFACCKCTGVFAPVAGGLLRFFCANPEKYFTDFGYAIFSKNRFATNLTYNRSIKIQSTKDSFTFECSISPVKKFMPSYWARIGLRLACSTALGSKFARQFINTIRKKKGTTINQSSANLSASKSSWSLKRKVSLKVDHVLVVDEITCCDSLTTNQLFFLESIDDNWMKSSPITSKLTDLPEKIDCLTITKIYCYDEIWRLSKISSKF